MHYRNLTASQKNEYQSYFNICTTQKKEVDTKLKTIRDIRTWVSDSITLDYRAFIEDCTTLAEKLAELQKRVKPDDYAQEDAVIEAYQRAKQAFRTMKVEDALKLWERTLKEAQLQEIPDVHKQRPVRDFLKAVRHIDNNFYDKHMDQLIGG